MTLGNLAVSYVLLDRFEEAKATAEKVLAKNAALPATHVQLLRIAYMQEDEAAQQREIPMALRQARENG